MLKELCKLISLGISPPLPIHTLKVRYVDGTSESEENQGVSLQANRDVQNMKEAIVISGRKAIQAFCKESCSGA